MAARLTRLGYRVLEAENGRVGLDVARRERPDLLIVDWMMPEMDGPTFCEAVRRDPLLKSSQILLMTAHDTAGTDCRRVGARRRRLSQ